MELKDVLIRYLQIGRDAVLWKLEGLGEYDIRRPMTPTGTNLLGLVKHLASVEAGYFGETFGRPFPEPFPCYDESADPNADMWATAEESREQIIGLYQRVWAWAGDTFETRSLDAEGVVPHWPADRNRVSLGQILVHVATETHRHAGHADIVRETIDGAAGVRAVSSNLPGEGYDWPVHVARVEQAARDVAEAG